MQNNIYLVIKFFFFFFSDLRIQTVLYSGDFINICINIYICFNYALGLYIVNRLCVAVAVLQTPLLLTQYIIDN